MTRTLVVDADSHVMEPPDLWLRWLEPEFRDRAIRIETVDGIERLVIGEQVVLQGVLAGLGGAHQDRARLFSGELRYTDGCPPASWDPAERAKLLDDWGVDAGVIFPTVGILPFPTDDHALASAYCRAYNRWQHEFARAIRRACRSRRCTCTISPRRRASSTGAWRTASAACSCRPS
jgi:hypothetical protein